MSDEAYYEMADREELAELEYDELKARAEAAEAHRDAMRLYCQTLECLWAWYETDHDRGNMEDADIPEELRELEAAADERVAALSSTPATTAEINEQMREALKCDEVTLTSALALARRTGDTHQSQFTYALETTRAALAAAEAKT
jgi:hypothetical protein